MTPAEQQLFDFYVNGTAANDVTNPGYGGADDTFVTGGFASYRGPGQGPHDPMLFPNGFQTTSSGPGAISEASGNGRGTQGGTVTNGHTANDAYDGYGNIGFKQDGNIVLAYGGLTVTRTVDVTHGPGDATTPITQAFTKAGVPNAARWIETVTNTTDQTITGTLAYFTNMGSDNGTQFVGSSSGDAAATSGNLYLTSIQNSTGADDPVITAVLGNNSYTLNTATMTHADGDDNPEWDYPISIAPGQTINLALFSVLTANIAYDPTDRSSDIAPGGQLASLITNGGQPIAADSTPFSFFTGLSYDQLSTLVNFDFVGLTIDTSRPYFVETDFAAIQSSLVFDGGTLRPTIASTFGQPTVLDASGGTVDTTDGAVDLTGVVSGIGLLTVSGTGTLTLSAANTYSGGTRLAAGTLELGQLTSAGTAGIAFTAGAQTLRLDTIGTYANAITGFSTDGDVIALAGINSGTATASYDGTTLTVTDGTNTDTLTIDMAPTGYQYGVVADTTGNGGTDVVLTAIPVIPTPAPTPDPVPTPVPAPPPVAPDAVALDQQVGYSRGAFTLTGRASSAAGVTGVEISAVLNDGTRQDLGAATLNGDGSFSFTDAIGRNQQGFLQATLTDGAGVQTVSADPGFSLTGGLTGAGGYAAQQTRYSDDGSATTAVDLFKANGSQKADVMAGGQTFHAAFFDTFLNNGAPASTFVFDPGYGLDTVRQFRVDGVDHDTLSFKGSDFGTDPASQLAGVLQNAHNGPGGVTITDPTSGDAVKLAGITKAQLRANPGDFAFHA